MKTLYIFIKKAVKLFCVIGVHFFVYYLNVNRIKIVSQLNMVFVFKVLGFN